MTIGYLAVQIKHSNHAQKRAALQDLTNRQSQLYMYQSDPDFAELLVKSRHVGLAELDEVERLRIVGYYVSMYRIYENYYLHYKEGDITEVQFRRAATPLRFNLQFKSFRDTWEEGNSGYSDEFREYVNKQIQELA